MLTNLIERCKNIWLRRFLIVVSFPYVFVIIPVVMILFGGVEGIVALIIETLRDIYYCMEAWVSVSRKMWNDPNEQDVKKLLGEES